MVSTNRMLASAAILIFVSASAYAVQLYVAGGSIVGICRAPLGQVVNGSGEGYSPACTAGEVPFDSAVLEVTAAQFDALKKELAQERSQVTSLGKQLDSLRQEIDERTTAK